ncbi:hypothetical protein ACFYRC_04030 [Streptomyces sp. NPDC005279]|uniref:hypothetical protein n=1 Tax=Streptomyces sp. NPDC005279 TaxID=3364712 RepID=UPI00369C6754
MAEESGTGAIPAIGMLGLMPFIGPVAAAAAADLEHEQESMETFKREVDKMLADLEESDAAPEKVTADRLKPGNLGTSNFRESAYLYSVYEAVHDELEKLSKILALQVSGLSFAVRASKEGYENIDYDIKQRMRKLATEVEAHYGKPAQQSGSEHHAGGGADSGDNKFGA